MRKSELFRLPVGKYDLTDEIDNFKYTLIVDTTNEGERCYTIKTTSYPSGQIFMLEHFEKEGRFKRKVLYAMSGTGGISLHTTDTYNALSDLKFVARGSFKQFVQNCASAKNIEILC